MDHRVVSRAEVGRPGPGPRRWTFAAAAVALLAFAAVLTAREPSRDGQMVTRPARPPRVAQIQTGPLHTTTGRARLGPRSLSVTATGRRAPAAGSERESARAPAVAPNDARHASATARRFLHGYLRYSYGRGDTGALRAAAAGLTGALKKAPPRVPESLTRARPRLMSVSAAATIGARAIVVVATIDDVQRRYEIPLRVRRARGRWVVTAIGG